MKAPKKIYIHSDNDVVGVVLSQKIEGDVEYTRTDSFIEKACNFLKSYRQDTSDGTGYIAGIVNDKTIDDFRKYMNGE